MVHVIQVVVHVYVQVHLQEARVVRVNLVIMVPIVLHVQGVQHHHVVAMVLVHVMMVLLVMVNVFVHHHSVVLFVWVMFKYQHTSISFRSFVCLVNIVLNVPVGVI
jgi:hypothetical protein